MDQKEQSMCERIALIFAKHYSVSREKFSMDTSLDEHGFGYLNRVPITMELEEEFDVEINDDEMEKISVFCDLVAYVGLLCEGEKKL